MSSLKFEQCSSVRVIKKTVYKVDSLLKGDNDIFLDNIFDNDDVFNDVFNDVLTQTSQSLNSYILVDF